MATPPNVELEAAKFLHKLIQESKDEPKKLATKLYVILQHMRSSGKENSMPYQVISRAMETVINENGLDIDALKSSRAPLSGGTHMGDSSSPQFAGSSQTAAVANDSKSGVAENERANPHASSRPPVGPSGAGHDIYQGSVSHPISKSLDHESPSSYDTKSANSQSQERHDPALDKSNQEDSKKASSKRKRADSSSTTEPHIGNSQQLDNCNINARKGNLANKVETPRSLPLRGSEQSQFNMVQGSGQMEHISSLPNSMRSTNLANSMQRAANPKYREEIEVSSAHSALALQQGGSRLSPQDILNSRGLWNQNRMGSSLEHSQVPRFPPNAGSGNSTAEIFMHQSTSSLGSGASGSYPPVEPGISSPMHFGSASREAFCAAPSVEPSAGKAAVDSEYWKHGFTKGVVANNSERTEEAFSANRRELVSSSFSTESGIPSNNIEMNMLRGAAPRDTGKSPIFQATGVSNMPFKEQHLKQLRAQCLVFLAFRNRVMPKKLHLEIALGNFSPREDGPSKELIDHKGKELSINDQSNIPEGAMLFGRQNDVRESEIVRQGTTSTGSLPEGLHEVSSLKEYKAPKTIQELGKSPAFLSKISKPDSSTVRGSTVSNGKDHLDKGQAGITNQASSIVGVSKQIMLEMVPHESVPERQDIAPTHFQVLTDCNTQRNQNADGHLTSFPLGNERKPISRMEVEHHVKLPLKDANVSAKNVSEGSTYLSEDDQRISEIQRRSIPDGFQTAVDDMRKNGSPAVVKTNQVEQDIALCTDGPPAPKYTTSEKWILEQQKRKLVIEQNWALKQKKTDQRITACSDKLKENVSSSEDISAKTKSVIELKKLQLLELQRRLRSDILNDFFKPVSTDMDRLKSVKKTRIGRRSKQIERFEQRMKEERQKRIKERQKEFFSEIEVHKERLDDVFKMKRERWKGFNKYVREFHKRKERIHREKIDRIQREKINLLKINDVEGYLRMVQDAKSDRVKQLLKETEKYLQKLGSKLRDAKAVARHFETDVEENRAASVVDNTEFDVENEDEADQAKHYLESNEKYYLMAHSIKESIMEQPTCLGGGKLREYQMNGLRWLVSLYNNHLNGILADEMGLGKTVQVISLICYLMETKNDRGPFLIVVPSSVLPGWETEINFWAPSINRIVYSGSPEERRRLFKERIVQQKFNVLLTTYEYLMNKHDRPKLSKLHWHYIIIDEGHRIKNASCKLNADLKHYQSSHRLLLTGTPLQNNLEELWALLNFLLPNIFNSSEDFSQWFNKPFESNGDSSADQALLSEEENLLIINRLHQVLRPFVLRRLKHKVENQLPEKIERLVRCEASSYQKLLMKRVEDNLGAIGTSKARSVHNSVMELRNICNHPYLSQLHVEEVHDFVPQHYLPNVVRLCGKLEMLDRLLPKLKATDHRVLFFSTMTRLLDVMEDYLCWKQYRYLRLDGHTSGGDRGALIDRFNQPGSPFFIFLLSIRAGGVGVNLQAADTVIIFDTDWNPQVDLQAQARAHRIGQKKEVLVLRLETVQTVEEQVRAAAEHKLGVANQSITAGFFDNNTSAEDRREYLESLLRECKKEETAPVLDDDSLNDLIARSESEIDIFEAIDRQRLEEEMAMWKNMSLGHDTNGSEPVPPLPSRLLTDDELKSFYEAIKTYEANARAASNAGANVGAKRKSGGLGGLDIQHYGRGKRAREVRSYEEQWTEEEFEKLCQADSPDSPKPKEELIEINSPILPSGSILFAVKTEVPAPLPVVSPQAPTELPPVQQIKEVTPPSKRGRGRPKRVKTEVSPHAVVLPALSVPVSIFPAAPVLPAAPVPDPLPNSATAQSVSGTIPQFGVWIAPSSDSKPPLPSISPGAQSISTPPSAPLQVKGQNLPCVSPGVQSISTTPSAPLQVKGQNLPSISPGVQSISTTPSAPLQVKGQNRKTRRGKNQASLPQVVHDFAAPSGTANAETICQRETVSSFPAASFPDSASCSSTAKNMSNEQVSVAPPVLPVSTDTIRAKSGLDAQLVSHTIPVLIDSSQTVRTEVVSEVQTVSSNTMVPVPISFSDTSIVSGVARTIPHVGVGIGPSSQLNPPSTYIAIGSESINPSPPVPQQAKGRGRGRGRRPQSGVEAPLRRGRRRGPVAPVGEDPKLNEPQSQLQVSSGRKSIGTRRKRQNEALEPTNVNTQEARGHLLASSNAAVLSDKTDSQKIGVKVQEMNVPLQGEAGVSESKVARTKMLEAKTVVSVLETAGSVVDPVVSKPAVHELATKIDAGLSVSGEDSRDLADENSVVKTAVQGTSGFPLRTHPSVDKTCDKPPSPDASVLDLKMKKFEDQCGKGDVKEQRMEGSGPDTVIVSKTVETKNLEGKISALSMLETNAPVVDPVTEKTLKEVDTDAQEVSVPSLQEAVDLDSEACEPETNINAGSFENADNPRDLVKESSIVGTIVEGTAAVPLNADPLGVVPCERSLAPDASVLETEVSVSSDLDISVDRSGKEDARAQDMICPVQDDAVVSEPGESVSLEEKQFSTLSRLEPEAPVVDTETEKTQIEVDAKALESYDSTSKESVVSKHEACEPETKLKVVPSQNLADSRDLVEENSTMDCDDQSGKEDMKEQGAEGPIEGNVDVAKESKFVSWSTSEKAPPVDSESEMIEKNFDAEAQESSDPILQEAIVSNPMASEPECNTSAGSFENVADPVDLLKENLIVETNVEGSSDVPLADPVDLLKENLIVETDVEGSSDVPLADPVDLLKENLIVETNVEGSSDVPLSVEPLDDMPADDVACLDLIGEKSEDNRKEDVEEQKLEGLLLDEAIVPEIGVLGTKGLEQDGADVDPETARICKIVDAKAQESEDPFLSEAVALKPEGCEPESKLESLCSENAADPRDVAQENSTGPLENVACEKPPIADDLSWETADSETTMGEFEDQSGKENMVLDKVIDAESSANEDQISEERTFSSLESSSLHENPETQPNAGPSENVGDSEQPIVEERKDKVQGTGFILEPVVTENQSLEGKTSNLETQSKDCSSGNLGDLEPIVEERKDRVLDKGFVLEPVATESQSLEEETSTLEALTPVVDPLHEIPETQLNAVSSENMGDSEPTAEGKIDTVLDKRLVSEPVVTENKSLEENTSNLETNSSVFDSPHEKPETQLNVGSSETVVHSEQICKDKPINGEPVNSDASLHSSPLGVSIIQMDSALATEGAKESSSMEESKSSEQNSL